MAAPDNTISGMGLGGTINNNEISGVYQYEYKEVGDKLDATVGKTRGKTRTDTGCVGAQITLHCYFDLAEAVFIPLRFGAWVENLRLYDDLQEQAFAFIPLAKVTDFQKTGQVRGKLEYLVTVETWGDWDVFESALLP